MTRLMPLPDQSPPTSLQTGHDGRTDLLPAPTAAMEVLDGTPTPRALLLSHGPEGLTSGLWDCTAGRFRWTYGSDEIVHVLEGGVIVEDADGRAVTLGPGDVAHFAAGTVYTWTVPEYVRKLYVDRALPADPLSRAVRALRRIAARRHRSRRY